MTDCPECQKFWLVQVVFALHIIFQDALFNNLKKKGGGRCQERNPLLKMSYSVHYDVKVYNFVVFYSVPPGLDIYNSHWGSYECHYLTVSYLKITLVELIIIRMNNLVCVWAVMHYKFCALKFWN